MTTPKISEVQRELAKFLEDFEAVKHLVEDIPSDASTSTGAHRDSLYDNVPYRQENPEDSRDSNRTATTATASPSPPPSSSRIPTVPDIRITNPTLNRDLGRRYAPTMPRKHRDIPPSSSWEPSQQATQNPPPSPRQSAYIAPYSTFPRAQLKTFESPSRPSVNNSPPDHPHRRSQDDPQRTQYDPQRIHEDPTPSGSGIAQQRPFSPAPSVSGNTQGHRHHHVQCNKCGEFLCKSDAAWGDDTTDYQMIPCIRCARLLEAAANKMASSMEDPSTVDDSSWRSHHGGGRVRFVLDDYNNGDKMAIGTGVRWGSGAKVVPIKGNHKHHLLVPHRKQKKTSSSRVRGCLVILAALIVILSLLGIVVAVTCASILSAIQEETKGTLNECREPTYKSRLLAAWVYNESCNLDWNISLSDMTNEKFIRASKVYETMLDGIFRTSTTRIKNVFDFTKVDSLFCSFEETAVWVEFKIFWQQGNKSPPLPNTLLTDFVNAIYNKEIKDISVYTISFEGYSIPREDQPGFEDLSSSMTTPDIESNLVE